MILKKGFLEDFLGRRLIYIYDLVSQLVIRELKLLYKQSFLGIAWTLINPLLQLLVFYLIFHSGLKLKIYNYASFVLTGLLVWNWWQNSLVQGAGAIVSNAYLIRQPGFPKAILPVIVVITGMIHFVLALLVLFWFLLIERIEFHSVILELPLLMLLQFGLTLGIAYILAAVNVTFRDTKHTIDIVLRLLFFLTPIFYDLSTVPTAYHKFYFLNPMVDLVIAYRAIVLDGVQPNWLSLLPIAGLVIVLLLVGLRIFRQQSDRFVEEI